MSIINEYPENPINSSKMPKIAKTRQTTTPSALQAYLSPSLTKTFLPSFKTESQPDLQSRSVPDAAARFSCASSRDLQWQYLPG